MLVSHVVFVSMVLFIVFFFAGLMVRCNHFVRVRFCKIGIIAIFLFLGIIEYHQMFVNPNYDLGVSFLLMGLLYLNMPATPIVKAKETTNGDLRFRRTKAYLQNLEKGTSLIDKILNGAESLISKIKSVKDKK